MDHEKHQKLSTILSHIGRAGSKTHGFVNLGVQRGSTVLYTNMEERYSYLNKKYDQALTYGLHGSETHHALEDAICAIEGGTRCQIVSTGLSAITTPLLAYMKSGDQILVPDSAYGPLRGFLGGLGENFGFGAIWYDPLISPEELRELITPEVKVLYVESPGSHTFEMQDVPALAAVAHGAGLVVMMDNTWGFGHFDPFKHGVDVSIQALTKYAVGHSDVLLGGVITADEHHWRTVRDAALSLGQYASPDDCWLTLRGLRTLVVRQKQQLESALIVTRWLREQPEVAEILFPPLEGTVGHDIWARDFTGGASLFGLVFAPEIRVAQTHALVDALKLFGIGASWGGYESLALPTTGFITRVKNGGKFAGPVVRFHIGLEDPEDLIADLAAAFKSCLGS